jgi:hypothetical protein
LVQLVVQRNKLVLFLIHVLYINMYVGAKVRKRLEKEHFFL